jgi:hypothetical protein
MMKLPKYFIFPRIGFGNVEVNIVPVDFVTDAIAYLSGIEESVGKVYHLTCSKPRTTFELTKIFAKKLGKKFLYFGISPGKLKFIMKPKLVQKLIGMPVQIIDYFDHQVHYDMSNSERELSNAGITCPDIMEYIDVMIEFVKNNKRATHGMV